MWGSEVVPVVCALRQDTEKILCSNYDCDVRLECAVDGGEYNMTTRLGERGRGDQGEQSEGEKSCITQSCVQRVLCTFTKLVRRVRNGGTFVTCSTTSDATTQSNSLSRSSLLNSSNV